MTNKKQTEIVLLKNRMEKELATDSMINAYNLQTSIVNKTEIHIKYEGDVEFGEKDGQICESRFIKRALENELIFSLYNLGYDAVLKDSRVDTMVFTANNCNFEIKAGYDIHLEFRFQTILDAMYASYKGLNKELILKQEMQNDINRYITNITKEILEFIKKENPTVKFNLTIAKKILKENILIFAKRLNIVLNSDKIEDIDGEIVIDILSQIKDEYYIAVLNHFNMTDYVEAIEGGAIVC